METSHLYQWWIPGWLTPPGCVGCEAHSPNLILAPTTYPLHMTSLVLIPSLGHYQEWWHHYDITSNDDIVRRALLHHLSPVLEEIVTEYPLLRVIMVQHLGKESCCLLGLQRQIHWSPIIDKPHVFWQGFIWRGKVGALQSISSMDSTQHSWDTR